MAPGSHMALNKSYVPGSVTNFPQNMAQWIEIHQCLRAYMQLEAIITCYSSRSCLLQGGMAALILRLRQDGHEELQVYGPRGRPLCP